MKFKYDHDKLLSLLCLLMDLNIVENYFIKGYTLEGVKIRGKYYGDWSDSGPSAD